jgi:hypothetical protein
MCVIARKADVDQGRLRVRDRKYYTTGNYRPKTGRSRSRNQRREAAFRGVR